jgi:hypothetical protein
VGLRLWKGLAILLALALGLSAVATLVVINDPSIYQFRMSPLSFMLTVGRQCLILLIGYGIGAVGRWLFDRIVAKRS